MHSIRRNSLVVPLAVAGTLVVAGCATIEADQVDADHTITIEGSRAYDYKSLDQLADKANAIVVAEPTGKSFEVPLPAGYGDTNSAPTLFVKMKILRVIDGKVDGEEIDVVSPGKYDGTGEPALFSGGEALLFLAPAMYAANDPLGGYVVVGGPAGSYVSEGREDSYVHLDTGTPDLPSTVTLGATTFPEITKTEEQLLAEGP